MAACQTVQVKPPVPAPEPEPEVVSGLDPKLGRLVRIEGVQFQVLPEWAQVETQVETTSNTVAQPSKLPPAPFVWESPPIDGKPNPTAASMNLIVGEPKPLALEYPAYWKALSTEYRARTEGVQTLLEEGEFAANPLPAWFFELERQEQGVRFKIFQVILGNNEHLYYLTYCVRAEVYDTHRELFERSAATFRLAPGTAVQTAQ